MPGRNEIPGATQYGGGQIEQSRSGKERPFNALILFFACLFSGALARERGLHTLFFAGLQVEGVSLNLLDDVFLLHLALEAAQSILEGFTLLKPHFCQNLHTPRLVRLDPNIYDKDLTASQVGLANFFTVPGFWPKSGSI